MTKRSVFSFIPQILELAGPMAGARLINTLTFFFGMMYVGHLGPKYLAASGLINSTNLLLTMAGMSILFSFGVVVAKLYGRQKYTLIGATFQQALLLAVILTVPIALCCFFMHSILRFFHQDPSLLPLVKQYYRTAIWAVFPSFLSVILQQLCFVINKQKIVIICNIVGFLLFIPLAHGLTHGTFFLPKMGLKGLAIAILFSYLFNVALLFFVITRQDCKHFKLFGRHNHYKLKHIKKLFRVGWPMAIQFTGEILILCIIGLLIGARGRHPVEALAAFQILMAWQSLCIIPIFGVTDALSIIVGKILGEKKFGDLKYIIRATLLIVGFLCAYVMLIYICIPEKLANIYGLSSSTDVVKNKIIYQLVRVFFQTASLALVLIAIRDILVAALRGLQDTQFAMWVSSITLIVITLGGGYFLVDVLNYHKAFYFIAYAVSFLVATLLLIPRWRLVCQRHTDQAK
jgi:multidrug resistance protein, MATE family